ncbi:MAG TPA: hypothetical protein VEO00_05055, partial [Actinomycetota bacterium]|nr:hypothetical protein [Actinomycetota bacterium]
AVDPERADELLRTWSETRLPVALEAVHCPDRNIGRCTVKTVARLQGPRSEVTLVIPRRDYTQGWHRLLHDRTSRTIARAVGDLAHVDVVVVPYRLGAPKAPPAPAEAEAPVAEPAAPARV